MKITPNSYSLQPDGADRDEDVAVCVCGHEEHWHEPIGAGWWFEGACETAGCPCRRFRLYDDEEED